MFSELPAQPWLFPHCPTPPAWTVDWPAIEQRFAWVRALAGVPQDAIHHAEGDVLIHTRMVAEALTGLEAWRRLPEAERSLLFGAALLHDVGKPACTQVAPDGRIMSPKHAQVGATMTRTLLWTGADMAAPAPFPQRETLTRLVRFHGLPLWWLERDDLARAVIGASQSVRLDWVALLAEADVRGRVCADQAELLARVALFRQFCQEQGCFDRPYRFANDHSRVLYFRTLGREPDYAAYDDTHFTVVLMSGLPGVGKDTWISQHRPDWPIVSLDELRTALAVELADTPGEVVQQAKAQARALLRQRQSFVWNATNVTLALRRQLIDLFAGYGARVRIGYLDAPFDALLRRNRNRAASVPEAVLRKLMRRLDVPDLTEAHDVVWVWKQEDAT